MPTTTTCRACRAGMREADTFCWTCGERREPVAPQRLEVVTEPRARPRSWPVVGVVALGLVAAVGVSLWWLLRPSDDAARTVAAPSPSAAPATASAPAPVPPAEPAANAPAPTATYPVGPVVPTGATAPSTSPDSADAAGRTTGYDVENVLDGSPSTAWRTEGDATGSTLTFTFDGTVRLTEVGLVNGFAKVDPYDGTDRYEQGRRITAVTWTFRTAAGPVPVRQTLRDGDRGVQRLTVTPVEATAVDLTIEDVTRPGAGGRFDRTAISDVAFANS
ncbi:NADase-type glycan-binding domain-containing protein [Kineococcus sp. SYSU DK001]|uniref:NADase-type glycan-binding domain-containing protein n=1 Tax=Kineococcus sp. SYSU DK001 TaxID=3383122 RepID=UPI003D7CDF4D